MLWVCVRNGYCHSRMLPTVRRLLTGSLETRIEFSNRPRDPSFFSFFFPDSLFPSLCVCYLTHQQTIEGGGGGRKKISVAKLCLCVCVSNGRGGVSRRANGWGWLYRRRRQSTHFSDPVPFSIRSRRRLCIYQSLENLCAAKCQHISDSWKLFTYVICIFFLM